MATFPRGSEWRRWDLHVHSPLSFEWRNARLDLEAPREEKDAILAAFADAITAAPVDVVAIVDYYTVDGYIALREYLRRTRRAHRSPDGLPSQHPGLVRRLLGGRPPA